MAAPSRPRLFQSARLFGYDIFISFALGPPPRGSRSYASDLARKLRERDYTVFFSEDEAPVGGELDGTLKRALRRSRLLVVVANRATLGDPRWVRAEVEEFRRRHPGRAVVPIAVDGALNDPALAASAQPWLGFQDRIWVDETAQAMADGVVSDEVIQRLVTAPQALRSAVRWRLLAGGTVAVLSGLTLYAFEKERQAQRAAVAEALSADQARASEGRASEAARRADLAASKALAAAEGEARAASAARESAAEARRQRDEAVRQRDAALARQLVVHASTTADAALAAQLALEALAVNPVPEGVLLLRERLASLAPPAGTIELPVAPPQYGDYRTPVFSPQGRYLAVEPVGGQLTIVDVATGGIRLQLEGGGRVAFSADEQWLAWSYGSRRADLIRMSDGARTNIADGEGEIASFAFTPDARLLAVGLWTNYPFGRQRNGHLVVEVGTGRRLAEGRADYRIGDVAWLPETSLLVTYKSGDLLAWPAADGFAAPRPLADKVRQWAVDPGGAGVFALDAGGRLRRVHPGAAPAPSWELDAVGSFAISADGQRLAITRAAQVQVLDRAGKVLARLEGAASPATTMAFVDGHRRLRVDDALFVVDGARLLARFGHDRAAWHPTRPLAATLGRGPAGTRVQWWRADADLALARLPHGGGLCAALFLPDGERLLTASEDGKARIWRWREGRVLTQVDHGRGVSQAWMAPDGESFVAADDRTARWWRTADGRLLGEVGYPRRSLTGFGDPADCMPTLLRPVLAWHRSGPRLAVPVDGEHLVVKAMQDGRTLKEDRRPTRPDAGWDRGHLDLALSPDGEWLASHKRTADDRLVVHGVGTGLRRVLPLQGFPPGPLAFTPQGELVAWHEQSDGQPPVMAWQLPAGTLVSAARRAALARERDALRPADGRATLTVSNGVLWLHPHGPQALPEPLQLAPGQRALGTSPDGRFVALAGRDGVVQVWPTRLHDLLAEACRRLPQRLDAQAWQRYAGSAPRRDPCAGVPRDPLR